MQQGYKTNRTRRDKVTQPKFGSRVKIRMMETFQCGDYVFNPNDEFTVEFWGKYFRYKEILTTRDAALIPIDKAQII
jgi:hypothetical protein